MTRACRRTSVFLTAAVLAGAAHAAPAAALAVTVPSSASLGTAQTGSSSLTAQLGTITATNTSALTPPNLTAQVSCSAFKTGGGTANETVPCAMVSYWSGPATAQVGLATATPGQIDAAHAVALGSARTAFTVTGSLLTISVSWNPTLIVTIPSSAVAGSYSGTITHSVA